MIRRFIRYFATQRRRRELARREIFQYHDGLQERSIDPMAAWETLWHGSHQVDPREDFALATGYDTDDGGNPVKLKLETDAQQRQAADARKRVTVLVCDMFHVLPYSQYGKPGLTFSEMTDLLFAFLIYMGDLKKKHDYLPMQPQPSGSKSSPPANSTTECESDSSSINDEPTTDEPQPSSKP